MFDFLKKKKATPAVNVNSFGELPWGWNTANKDFTDKIGEEYSYFWKVWIDARNGEPSKEMNALKSLLQYMDDVQKMCDQKGECFGFWCSEYLIGKQKKTGTDRLADLETNMKSYIQEYEERQKMQVYEATLTDEMMFDAINQHEGMLQKDLCKLFPYPSVISSKLYSMSKEGKIERIKSGNSYELKVK